MRVLLCSHTELAAGGAELALLELVQALRLRHPEIELVVTVRGEGPLAQRLRASGVSVHVLKTPWWITIEAPRRFERSLTSAMIAKNVPTFARLMRRVRPDLVVSNTVVHPCAALAARTLGIPHVWQVQEFGEQDHGWHFLLGERLSYRVVDKLSRIVTAPSQAVAEALAVGETPIRIVRYSVEATETSTLRYEPSPRTPDGSPVLVLVGHRRPAKGQLDAIEAVKVLAANGLPTQLRLVGRSDDGYDDVLRTHAQRLGVEDAIEFVPPVSDLRSIYAAADIALMCSRNEALGRVTVEAMKAGVPLIGADAGGTSELLADGRGLLYRPGDVPALARAIKGVADQPEAASRRAKLAQAWSEQHFNARRYVEDTVSAWSAALATCDRT